MTARTAGSTRKTTEPRKTGNLTEILRKAPNPPKITGVSRALKSNAERKEPASQSDRDVQEQKDRQEFTDLVEALIPQHAENIESAGGSWDQIVRFANLFSREYFPLNEYWIEYLTEHYRQEDELDDDERMNAYQLIMQAIPVGLIGIEDEHLHEIWDGNQRDGLGLAALLVRFHSYGEHHRRDIEGMRQQWLDAAQTVVPQEVLERIPEWGIPIEQIEKAMQGTPLEGITRACEYIGKCTGNAFLDETLEEESGQEYSDPWTIQNVRTIRDEWIAAQAIMEQEKPALEWLERDPGGNFEKLLDFLLERIPPHELRTEAEHAEAGQNTEMEQA